MAVHIGSWRIKSCKRPILSNAEIEAHEKELGLPLPEMTFGNNSLVLEYGPEGEGCTGIAFDTMHALAGVATGEGWEERVGGGVLVSMAETWSKGR
jgi:type 2A phosphatase activator TIP41